MSVSLKEKINYKSLNLNTWKCNHCGMENFGSKMLCIMCTKSRVTNFISTTTDCYLLIIGYLKSNKHSNNNGKQLLIIDDVVNMLKKFIPKSIDLSIYNNKLCVREIINGDQYLTAIQSREILGRNISEARFFSKKSFNKGILNFKLKLIKSTCRRTGIIGICSDMDVNMVTKETAYISNAIGNNKIYGDTCYWNRASSIYCNNKYHGIGKSWDVNDVVCVMLNCNKWCISFIKNDKIIFKSNIKANKYYFMISFGGRDKYQIIST